MTWLGALPPVLAQQTAVALLPRMHRLRVPAGRAIEWCGEDVLLLLEDALPVMCAVPAGEGEGEGAGEGRGALRATCAVPTGGGGEDEWTSGREGERAGGTNNDVPLPAVDVPLRAVVHPAGSVLCLTSTLEPSGGGRLQWHSVSAPDGGLVSAVGRLALCELVGEVRKSAVRRHAKQLASASYFAPLSTAQLLSLCHRAAEIQAAPSERIDTKATLSAAPTVASRSASMRGGVSVSTRDGSTRWPSRRPSLRSCCAARPWSPTRHLLPARTPCRRRRCRSIGCAPTTHSAW